LKFRRGRIFAEGRVRKMDFRLEFDFAADAGFKDVYLEGIEGGVAIWGHPLGKLRYGHFKEPFSLERQMSANHLGFLEWSLPVGTFAPGRNLGFMIHDKAKSGRFSWAFGVFSFGQQADDNASTSAFSLTTRWTGLPIYRDDGRTLLHLGASFSSRTPTSGTAQFASRPEARFAPYLADTGEFDARGNTLLGFEAAGLRGPVWFQGEYIEAATDSVELGDPRFSGFYAQAGWFLTGDIRPYRKANGVWSRVRPKTNYRKGNPFKRSNGGSWELMARFSKVDLDGGDIRGGMLTNLSAGVSWYLNSTSRVMANFIHSKTEINGNANIFLIRYQYNPN
jgi:phosphate-selective porin OprO/OprP